MRLLRVIAGIGLTTIVVIGCLHLRFARPLLPHLGVVCPVDAVSPAAVASLHHSALLHSKGEHAATSRERFGFEIGRTREADVQAWSVSHQLACAERMRGPRYVSCEHVAAATLGNNPDEPPITNATFTFDAGGTLTGIDLLRSGLAAETATRLGAHLSTELEERLGSPSARAGRFQDSYLSEGAFRTAFLRYRFTDLWVEVCAVSIPGAGVAVHEQYVGIPANDAL